ncbi:MAG: hypothetical protein R3F38_00460 [Gammaproteobacteria bacterium]
MASDTGSLHTERRPQLGQRILQREDGGLGVLGLIQQMVLSPHMIDSSG